MKEAIDMIVSTLERICRKKDIDIFNIVIERTANHTFYLCGKKVVMIVEWSGYKMKIYGED